MSATDQARINGGSQPQMIQQRQGIQLVSGRHQNRFCLDPDRDSPEEAQACKRNKAGSMDSAKMDIETNTPVGEGKVNLRHLPNFTF